MKIIFDETIIIKKYFLECGMCRVYQRKRKPKKKHKSTIPHTGLQRTTPQENPQEVPQKSHKNPTKVQSPIAREHEAYVFVSVPGRVNFSQYVLKELTHLRLTTSSHNITSKSYYVYFIKRSCNLKVFSIKFH